MKIPKGHNHETYKLGYEEGKKEAINLIKECAKTAPWDEETVEEIIDILTSQNQTPQTKTLKRSEESSRITSPKTSEFHEFGVGNRFLTDKTGESLRAVKEESREDEFGRCKGCFYFPEDCVCGMTVGHDKEAEE